MSIGQELLDVPFPEMIYKMANAIAQGQRRLDQASLDTARALAKAQVRVIPDIYEIVEKKKLSEVAGGAALPGSAGDADTVAVSTVTAGAAATVAFLDVENLLNAVPAAYRTSGRCSIGMCPSAYMILRAIKDSSGAHVWPVNAPDVLYGFPVWIDNALPTPATTARSMVAGDFRTAYAIKLAPLKIARSSGQDLNTWLVQVRTVMRVDGKPLVTDACRALVHP